MIKEAVTGRFAKLWVLCLAALLYATPASAQEGPTEFEIGDAVGQYLGVMVVREHFQNSSCGSLVREPKTLKQALDEEVYPYLSAETREGLSPEVLEPLIEEMRAELPAVMDESVSMFKGFFSTEAEICAFTFGMLSGFTSQPWANWMNMREELKK